MRRKYFTYRKYMGDDIYSYAVFKKGSTCPIVTGLSRSSAMFFADKFEKEEVEKRKEN